MTGRRGTGDQLVPGDRQEPRLVLEFAMAMGERNVIDSRRVGHDDGLVDGDKPPVLSAAESVVWRREKVCKRPR